MSNETMKTVYFAREFLGPEQTRYDQPYCQGYVYFDEEENDPLPLEAELIISDGYNHSTTFDFAPWDKEPDEFLAMITKLMEQVIAFRQGFAAGLAIQRGQATTSGAGETVEMITTLGASE